MKLSEFTSLCEREWGKQRGDVISLALTAESADELDIELLLSPDGPHVPAFRVGELCNPVTRSSVKIYRDQPKNRAEVVYFVDVLPSGGV